MAGLRNRRLHTFSAASASSAMLLTSGLLVAKLPG
jgi:hypothetical protein